eukprot:CAMPEP_0195541510 /NCGR_PEP_ID=MMETSP0794_2-20130614/51125_1 /TAXON_ID=515487 /ORGANISM="Stephanopyxis turris, Strain CCMP 815" /LENGTH=615 /DNA_ID=CAMNT_0040675613 /DNA_START=101 /DNA_END=1948 /DNA_ORIENTATION=-
MKSSGGERRSLKFKNYVVGAFLIILSFLQFLMKSCISEKSSIGVNSLEGFMGPDNVASLIVVPFDAYSMRDDDNIMKHQNCKKTIIIRKLPDWTDKPFVEINYSDVKDLFSEQNEDMLCLQVASTATVGAIVLASSNHKMDGVSLLGSDSAELVARKLEGWSLEKNKSRNDLQLDIVEHKTIAMIGWYEPPSPEVVAKRQKNDNTGNFVWAYGATRMINPYTTSFIKAEEGAKDPGSAYALVIANANSLKLSTKNLTSYNRVNWMTMLVQKIDKPTILLGIGIQAKFEEFEEIKDPGSASALVIANANSLELSTKNSISHERVKWMTTLVQKIDKPTILLGIGIQAKFEEFEEIKSMKLHEHQALLFNEIGKRNQASKSASVRGDFTHVAATNAGVNNTISLGCPSLTISHTSNLGNVLKKKWNAIESLLTSNQTYLEIGITLPAFRLGGPNYEKVVGSLLSICKPHDCYFIAQAAYDREQLLKFTGNTIDKDKILWYRDGVEDWFKFVQSLDFLVSTRIHGGMAGIVNGVPTLIIPTDYRIMELVNAMKLPHISFEKATNTTFGSLSQMMTVAKKDFVAFEANRRNHLKEYKHMLGSVGLEMDPALVKIINENK